MRPRVPLLALVAGLAGAWGTSGRALGQEPLGDFYYFGRSDPRTGADRSSITTLAEESFVSGAGGLTVRCVEDGIELVLTASHLGRAPSVPVRFSFGDEEPASDSWTLRSTGMAAIAPRDVTREFLSQAVSQSRVVFSVSDFQRRVHTYTFGLGGLDSALSRLSCF